VKPAYTETYSTSVAFNAPLSFVYVWCTDFQNDDLRMIGSKNRRNIHEKSEKRVIWTVEGMRLPTKTEPVRVVWLRPPDAWHLETCGDGSETGDYKLTAIGRKKTRLDMTFTETNVSKAALQSREDYIGETLEHWRHYGKQLERDYQESFRGTKASRN
jgi:hypothetical protein